MANLSMVFEHIEKLKKQYTDKFVIVNDQVPELRRFRGQTGIVKTVNMSGRALVQFDAYDNIGWYDIDPDFLKVIDQPLPKPEPKAKAKAAPAAKSEAKPAAKEKPAAAAPVASGAGGKANVADILAAARANKGGAAPASAPAKDQTVPKGPAPTPAATSPAAAKKADPKAMSMADILAAARANKSGVSGAPSAADPAPAAAAPPSVEKQTPKPPTATSVVDPPKPAAVKGPLPTTPEEIAAFCRKLDGKK